MIRGGLQRCVEENDFRYKIFNKLLKICHAKNVTDFIGKQQANYLAHIARQLIVSLTKRLLNKNTYCKKGRRTETLSDKVLKTTGMTINSTKRNLTQSSCWIWSPQVIEMMTRLKTQAEANRSLYPTSTKQISKAISSLTLS